MRTASTDRFPYMVWARTEAFASPYCLSVSGMPAPDPAVLGADLPIDLGPPFLEAAPALVERLARLFGTEPERILVCPGATGAMHLAAMHFFPGARVVTELPSYEPFRALADLYGASFGLLQRRVEERFRLPLEEVPAALAGHGPAHLFLCNPHNPTGALTGPEELRELAAQAERADGVLVSNEVYMEFAPPDRRFHAFQLAPNAISLGSLTKAYGLGPLRVGWMILGDALVEQRERLLDTSYLVYAEHASVALRAGVRALERLPELLRPVRAFEAECRPHLERWIERSDRVQGFVGPHGLTAFPRVLGVDDTRALARHLADTVGVAAVPGEFFGAPGHLRLGYGVPEATLVEGLERLERGIASYREGAGAGR